MIDATDRRIINSLQRGLPICERPFADLSAELGVNEHEIVERLQKLLDEKILSRFGPMFDAKRMGGDFTLAAMKVPADRFEEVAEVVNSFDEVAHNYERDHDYNMWFVVAVDDVDAVERVLAAIEERTGLPVLNLPKEEEYFLQLRLEA